jgi:molybdopterin synthase catalytic subunit
MADMLASSVIRCAPDPLDPETEHKALRLAAKGDGALSCFTGIARPDSMTSDVVQAMMLQHYPGFTEDSIKQGVAQARQRWPDLQHVHIVHRVGEVLPAQPIVFVGTSAKHRRTAFLATDFLMDWLKSEAAFWKKEMTATGAMWIEPRAQDYADKTRWQNGDKDEYDRP